MLAQLRAGEASAMPPVNGPINAIFMRKNGKRGLIRGVLAIAAGILHILSLPPVRNYLWGKAVKGGEKVIDAKAKDVKKKRRLFG